MKLVCPEPAEWQQRFQAHQARIQKAVPGADVQHIGSTAIPGIRAKDVVDVLMGVPVAEIQQASDRLVALGYGQEGAHAGHVWLCWPGPEQREAVIHVMALGSDGWQKRLTFRDRLRADRGLAQEYEALKLRLAAQTDDWGEYTGRKAAFVNRILNVL